MAKTFTFTIVHFSVAFTVAYLISGSALMGGAIALVEPAINTIAFFLHEQVWVRWGGRGRPDVSDRGGAQGRMAVAAA